MIGEIRQNFTEASASVGLILATALDVVTEKIVRMLPPKFSQTIRHSQYHEGKSQKRLKPAS